MLNIDLFILHPENYQTAISQDREYYFNFELIHSLTFMVSSYYLNHKIVSNMYTFSIRGVLGIEVSAVVSSNAILL